MQVEEVSMVILLCLGAAMVITGLAFWWLSRVYINDEVSRKQVILAVFLGGILPLAVICIVPRAFFNLETPGWVFLAFFSWLFFCASMSMRPRKHH
jgi:hypothetical protein